MRIEKDGSFQIMLPRIVAVVRRFLNELNDGLATKTFASQFLRSL